MSPSRSWANVPALFTALYLALIGGIGYLPTFGFGLEYLYPGLALLLFAHASLAKQGDLYAALAVVPVLHLLALIAPLPTDSQMTAWRPLVVISLFPLCVLLTARALRYGRRDLGLVLGPASHRRCRLSRLGVRAGQLLSQLLIAASGLLIGWYLPLGSSQLGLLAAMPVGAAWFLGLALLVGVTEELYFRGVLQTAAVKVLGPVPGVIVPVLLTSALALLWLAPLQLALGAALGLIFGLVVLVTGSLLGTALARGLLYVVLLGVVPQGWFYF